MTDDSHNSLERVKEILLADYSKLNERRLKELEDRFSESIEIMERRNEELHQNLTGFVEREISHLSMFVKQQTRKLENADADLRTTARNLETAISELDRQLRTEKKELVRSLEALRMQISLVKESLGADRKSTYSAIQKLETELNQLSRKVRVEKETILEMVMIGNDKLSTELSARITNETNLWKSSESRLSSSLEAIRDLVKNNNRLKQ